MPNIHGDTRDPRWSSYPDAILEFDAGCRTLAVDLRRPLNQRGRDELTALQAPAPFGVITAANPGATTYPMPRISLDMRHCARAWNYWAFGGVLLPKAGPQMGRTAKPDSPIIGMPLSDAGLK